MIDYFALLDESRRLWLDADALKEKFLRLSAEAHPDRSHAAAPETKAACERRFAELTSAYNTLRDPRARAGHWLELARGAKPDPLQTMAPWLQGLIFEAGRLLRATEALLEEKPRMSSPLLKVQFFERCQPSLGQIHGVLQKIAEQQDTLHARLQELDAAVETTSTGQAVDERRVEEIYHALGFLSRSAEQLRERLFQLAA